MPTYGEKWLKDLRTNENILAYCLPSFYSILFALHRTFFDGGFEELTESLPFVVNWCKIKLMRCCHSWTLSIDFLWVNLQGLWLSCGVSAFLEFLSTNLSYIQNPPGSLVSWTFSHKKFIHNKFLLVPRHETFINKILQILCGWFASIFTITVSSKTSLAVY